MELSERCTDDRSILHTWYLVNSRVYRTYREYFATVSTRSTEYRNSASTRSPLLLRLHTCYLMQPEANEAKTRGCKTWGASSSFLYPRLFISRPAVGSVTGNRLSRRPRPGPIRGRFLGAFAELSVLYSHGLQPDHPRSS